MDDRIERQLGMHLIEIMDGAKECKDYLDKKDYKHLQDFLQFFHEDIKAYEKDKKIIEKAVKKQNK